MERSVPPTVAPARFQAALQSLKQTHVRPEVHLAEAPAPKRVAPYAVAIDGEVGDEAAPDAEGTLVVLYDPQGQENWDGQFRLVSYLEVQVDRAEACDPMLPSVAWSWVTDAIGHQSVHNLKGSVSLVSSTTFDGEGEKPGKSIVQIRASWSPDNEQVGPHLELWAEMLAMAGGLEHTPSDVTSLAEHRQLYHDGEHGDLNPHDGASNETGLHVIQGNPALANISPRHPSLHHTAHPLNTVNPAHPLNTSV
jgi:hypothetical protein